MRGSRSTLPRPRCASGMHSATLQACSVTLSTIRRTSACGQSAYGQGQTRLYACARTRPVTGGGQLRLPTRDVRPRRLSAYRRRFYAQSGQGRLDPRALGTRDPFTGLSRRRQRRLLFAEMRPRSLRLQMHTHAAYRSPHRSPRIRPRLPRLRLQTRSVRVSN